MTVAQLIAHLQTLPGELLVVTTYDGIVGDFSPPQLLSERPDDGVHWGLQPFPVVLLT